MARTVQGEKYSPSRPFTESSFVSEYKLSFKHNRIVMASPAVFLFRAARESKVPKKKFENNEGMEHQAG